MLAALCGLWIAGRFLPSPPADPALLAVIEAVRVRPAAYEGLLGVELPEASGAAGTALHGDPVLAAPRRRLREEIRSANEDLAHAAARVATLVDLYPDDSAALRIGGAPVPFFDRAAERLAQARRDADDRPGRALATVADVLRRRLAEPREDFLLEDAVRRRELTRVVSDAQEALDRAATAAATSITRFRREAVRAAGAATGPFQRRGPGRIFEIAWAALLGAGLRLLTRPEDGRIGSLGLAVGPTLAVAGLLAAEGTPLLPVDPVRGISLGFLPASVLLGWGGAALVARLASSAAAPAPPPPAPTAAARPAGEAPENAIPPDEPARRDPRNGDESPGDGAGPPRSERELPVDPGVAPPRRRPAGGRIRPEPRRPGEGGEKLPFFRKRRRRP
jgi:hypothetical protein